MHSHRHYHLILYLTEGAPLILPELKMTIVPKKGHYYIFPPHILHGVPKIETDVKTRYCFVTNIVENPDWKKNKLLKEFKDKNDI